MGNGDSQYYRRRVEQESAAAQTATSAVARDAHRALAERYAAKLRLIETLSTDRPVPNLHPAAPRPAIAT